MEGKTFFSTPEEILRELQCLQEESDNELDDHLDETCSETNDDILHNHDNVDNIFDSEEVTDIHEAIGLNLVDLDGLSQAQSARDRSRVTHIGGRRRHASIQRGDIGPPDGLEDSESLDGDSEIIDESDIHPLSEAAYWFGHPGHLGIDIHLQGLILVNKVHVIRLLVIFSKGEKNNCLLHQHVVYEDRYR
uniref:Uncharacterized protein n=1 Tax=Timema cristinae TaxID=61476 RepID=A0A7R9H053_TIMCR|nr:unnamed protein product [Timema cristinae]